MAKKKIDEIKAPIDWNVPDCTIARYATNMVVQRLENEFLISFFETKPPIILGDPDTIQQKIQEIKSIQADCIAQIFVASEKMPNFIDALQRNYERFLELKKE